MTKLTLLIFIITGFSCTLKAQSNTLIGKIQSYLHSDTFIAEQEIQKISSKEFKTLVQPYLNDSSPEVRYKALNLVKQYSFAHENEQPQIIINLIPLCKDADPGVAGSAISALTMYRKPMFNQDAISEINNLLKGKKIAHYNKFVLLAGFAGDTSTRNILNNKLVSDSTLKKVDKWNIQIALARLGDSTNFNYCFTKIKSQPVNDQVIDYLYTDLIYMHNQQGIMYLLQQIKNDNTDCITRTPDTEEPTVCGYKIMELVAPSISGFPVTVDSFGDLQTNDIKKSLTEVRYWIDKGEPIKINTERY